ncbi:MAG: phosphonate metabolism protein/1,5-bisphosphokinase (PRPP-forming) PhnN, partial [Pseudomonadota bacterium]
MHALIVGPSGSGKDALLAGARKQLADDPRFYFPKRVVSRTAHASEDFVSMTVDE